MARLLITATNVVANAGSPGSHTIRLHHTIICPSLLLGGCAIGPSGTKRLSSAYTVDGGRAGCDQAPHNFLTHRQQDSQAYQLLQCSPRKSNMHMQLLCDPYAPGPSLG